MKWCESRNAMLGERVREVRVELFGEEGAGTLAETLGLPEKTWQNYEGGVTMPAAVLLLFIEATGVNPHWLTTGEGEKYRDRPRDQFGRN